MPRPQQPERTPSHKQWTFAGGEITPELVGRTDLERYAQSVQTCRNFIVTPTGILKNRPGTKLVAEVKDSSKRVRLVPFVFNVDQAYALEFGDGYVRFHTLGGVVRLPETDTGTHDGGDDEVNLIDSGANWVTDEWVGATVTNDTTGASGTVTANTPIKITATVTGGSPDNLWDDGNEYTLARSTPTPVYEVVSPFLEADLPRLKYAQQNDVMILTHPNHQPQVLRRFGDTGWTLTPYSVVRPVNPPTAVGVLDPDDSAFVWPTPTTSGHNDVEWSWVVTSVDSNGNESLPSTAFSKADAVLYSDKDLPKVVWTPPTAGNAPASYNVYRGRNDIYGFIGSSKDSEFQEEAAAPDYSDSPPTQTDPMTYPVTSGEFGTPRSAIFGEYIAGVAVKKTVTEAFDEKYTYSYHIDMPLGSTLTLAFKSRPTGGGAWDTHDTKTYETGWWPVWGLEKDDTHTVDIGVAALDHEFDIVVTVGTAGWLEEEKEVTWTEPLTEELLPTVPATTCFFEQRLVFAGYEHNPQLWKASRTGDYFNFDVHSPPRDDDPLTLVLASLTSDEIRDVVPLKGLGIFTAGGEWVARGVDGGPLTTSNFDLKLRTKYGSAHVHPVAIGQSILFVTDRARRVREFTWDELTEMSAARDLTLLVEHLFRDYTLEEWAYSDTPYQVLWAVRSDGALLGMTYDKGQNVWSWHRHDTGASGEFESVCTIPEGDETKVYVAVKRTIDGGTKRYVEIFTSRRQTDDRDWVFLDSAITYEGAYAGSDVDMFWAYNAGTEAHDGGNDADHLTDSGESWTPDAFIGWSIVNLTKGEDATITDNDADEIWHGAGITDWDDGDTYLIVPPTDAGPTYRLRCDSTYFTSGMVGDRIRVTGSDGISFRFHITAFVDGFAVDGYAVTAVPSSLVSTASIVKTQDWGHCYHEFSGLDHLEGETIGLLVDGASHAQVAVSGGDITLGDGVWAEVLQAGVPIVADVKTLPLHVGDPGDIRTAKKLITTVHLEVDAYAGLWVGHDEDSLEETDERQVEEAYGSVTPEALLLTVRPESTWSRVVNVMMRQVDPLPVSILSVIVGVKAGGNK
jgi:hypothetical protein